MGFETKGGCAREEAMINRNDEIGEGKDSDHTELNITSAEEKSKDNNKQWKYKKHQSTIKTGKGTWSRWNHNETSAAEWHFCVQAAGRQFPAHWFCNQPNYNKNDNNNNNNNNTKMWQILPPGSAPFPYKVSWIMWGSPPHLHLPPTLFVFPNTISSPLLQKKFFGSGNWNFIYHLMPFFYMGKRFLIIRGNILFVWGKLSSKSIITQTTYKYEYSCGMSCAVRKKCQCFQRTVCLHIQHKWKRKVKTKAAGFSETSANFRRITPSHITGNGIRETHRHRNLKPHTKMRTVIPWDYFQNKIQEVWNLTTLSMDWFILRRW